MLHVQQEDTVAFKRSRFYSVLFVFAFAALAAAAPGMPNVEVAGLTIVPGERKLFAATHGLGAWSRNLPK